MTTSRPGRRAGLAAAAAAAALAGCGRQTPPPAPPPIRPVIAMTVEAPAARVRAFTGTARAGIETPLSFRVAGQIVDLPAKLGRHVASNEVIAVLDARDYDRQFKQNQHQVAQADSQLKQAQAEYDRAMQQYEAKAASKSQLDSASAAYHSARASAEAAREAMELARQQVEYCTLRAPQDGVLTSVSVEQHQTVSAGQPVATLAAGGDMEIHVNLPETLIPKVARGDEVSVAFEALPGVRFPARVAELGASADASGTYPVRIRLLATDPRIRSGMVGEAVFTFDAGPDAGRIVVPPVAVLADPAGRHSVWVIQPDTHTVARRPVVIGDLTPDGLQILDGLQPGERLVIRGVHQLQEGLAVKLLEP
jgi:RND family efflux transporter MFP subunit